VVGKAFQVRSAQVPQVRAKSQWIGGGGLDVSVQFRPELVSKTARELIVAAQGAADVFLDGRVVPDLH
jgi:hypothetical protein